MREVVIFGAGGHARSVADVILSNNPDALITFVDENAKPAEKIFGFDVRPQVTIADASKEYFIAIGDNQKRRQQKESLGGIALGEVIASDAQVGRDAELAEGCFVGHQAYIGPLAKIGPNTIINTRAIVEHEVQIGSNSQIAPGAVIGGRAIIGDNVFIGLGARVIDGISICSDTVVGAGAIVVDSIDVPGTYVGIPAKVVHSNEGQGL